MIGGMQETQEMLDYCAEHDIVSDIEMTTLDKVAEAYDRVVKVRRQVPLRHRHRIPVDSRSRVPHVITASP